MLWRESYRPHVKDDVQIPEAYSGVVLAGFDLRAQGEIGIWWRLCMQADLIAEVVLFLDSATPKERRTAASLFPPSWKVRLSSGEQVEAWRKLIDPDRPERSFAAIARGTTAEFLVIGPPTEEVWEEFELRARALRT